ncbi:hypothetical protein [Methanobrevibacter sp.]|uniref:hypothetical protein n=1 Tax=Methanobrevibacter sp. TaxID=66852 RepID=UPI00386FD94F
MITCSVCGHLNDPSRVTCEDCGSDLSDSPDWGLDDEDEYEEMGLFDEGDSSDDLNYDDSEELGYYDDEYYD